MRNAVLVALALLVAAAVIYQLARKHTTLAPHQSAVIKAQAAAPALTLTDLNGRHIDTSQYRGKVVLVNFWAAWCTPCAQEVPGIVALQERHRADGLEVVGISMDDTDTALRQFYAKYKMNYPVVPGNAKVAEAYGGILGLPTTILIGRDGRIRARYPGQLDFAKLEPDIAALLREHT